MSPRRVGDLSHWFTRHQLGKAMKLYEFAPTRSIRVRWTLQELAVEFEAITVNILAGEHRSPGFLKINPAGKLPVFVDGDMVLTESIAIVLYLAEKYRDKGLIPIDLQQRAQMMRWLLFTTTELEQPLWRMARHTTLYPENKRLPGELALARDDFADMANVLEEYMGGRKFLVGDTATVGDFVLAYTLDWAKMARCSTGCRGSKRTWRRCTRARVRRCASPRPSLASSADREIVRGRARWPRAHSRCCCDGCHRPRGRKRGITVRLSRAGRRFAANGFPRRGGCGATLHAQRELDRFHSD